MWLTGLPSAGKTTLGKMLVQALVRAGLKVHQFDGDEVRVGLCADLDFSRKGRHINNLRVAYVAGLLNRYGVCCVVSQIAPYEETRREVRTRIEEYVEVFVDCPLEQLINRDVKGLYKRALAGEIKNFTGVDDPYETPADPEVHLRTDRESPEESLKAIMKYLLQAGLFTGLGADAACSEDTREAYTDEEEEMVKKRLQDLGYI